MQFRFAFLVMSNDYHPDTISARFETPGCYTRLYGVCSLEEACRVAADLAREGSVDRIELCGAFGREGARQVQAAAGERLSVGYVVTLDQ
ncbi:MAG: hypothetical protein KH009_02935 [Clostridiales bacterium]|nr:hypothetical protein [Clostridiales bacterium]